MVDSKVETKQPSSDRVITPAGQTIEKTANKESPAFNEVDHSTPVKPQTDKTSFEIKEEETFESLRLRQLQGFKEKRGNDLLVLGIPLILNETVELVQRALQRKKIDNLDVVLKTHGGDPASAYKIAKILCRHAKKINIVVAERVKSAGTLVSLCAHEICMTEASELGPLDMQIRESEEGKPHRWKSALNGSKALEQIQRHSLRTLDSATYIFADDGRDLHPLDALKLAIDYTAKTAGKLYDGLDPKEVAEYARNLEEGALYARHVLVSCAGKDEKTAFKIADKLVNGYPSHGFVLDVDELKKIGLPAVTVDDEVLSMLIKNIAIALPDGVDEESFVHML